MYKNYNILSYFRFSILAAILYCITVVIFLKNESYAATWWLYVGNLLFMLVIFGFVWSFNKTKAENASTPSLVIAGHLTTVMGIVLSCIVSYILVVFFVPGLFHSGETSTTVANAPAVIDTGKTDGLVFMIFMNAVVGNVAAGSFASIIFSYTAKRDQTKDSAEIKYKIPQ